MADTIQYDTRCKDASETVSFLFDFSRFPEVREGETLSSPSVTSSPSGLTVGSPAVTSSRRDGVPAGQGVAVTISSGSAGTSYSLEALATTSGGAIRCVKGVLKVE